MRAHVTIEETARGWLVRGTGLDGKRWDVEVRKDGGVNVDVSPDDGPLPVALEAPEPK